MEIVISVIPENWKTAEETREIAYGVNSARVTALIDSAMCVIRKEASNGKESCSVYVSGYENKVISTAEKILKSLGYKTKISGNWLYIYW